MDGEIYNIGIESGDIYGSLAGAITSFAWTGAKIVNCYNKANITANCRAGGICDENHGVLAYCWNIGSLNGTNEATVLAGLCSCGDARIYNSYSTSALNLVADLTYSGAIKGSKRVEEMFGNEYKGYSAFCRKEEITKLVPIVPIGVGENTLSFMDGMAPSSLFERNFLYFPIVCLLIFAVFLGNKARVFLLDQDTAILSEEKTTDSSNNEKNSIKPRIFRSIITILAIFASIHIVSETLHNKCLDGVTNLENYYRQREDVDVVLIGSSRVGMNMDGETLWNKFGIYSFDLWGSVQPFWNSYYYLEEAIRVNKPKIVIQDVSEWAYGQEEYMDEYRQISNTLGIKSFPARLHSTIASVEPENVLDYMLRLPIYHERIFELSEDDFSHYSWINDLKYGKGYYSLWGTSEHGWTSGMDIVDYKAINEKERYYLEKIIELCEEEDIALIFVKTPTLSWEAEQASYNAVELFAEENGIPFINFNYLYDEIQFVDSDYYIDGHLNMSGGRKVSEYIGNYIKTNYDLNDRRNEKNDWIITASDIQNRYIHMIGENDAYFSELNRDKKNVTVIRYRLQDEHSDVYAKLNEMMGDVELTEWEIGSILSGQNKVDKRCFGEQEIEVSADYKELKLNLKGKRELTVSSAGAVVIVYDEVKEEVADISLFAASNGYAISHLYGSGY